MHLARLVVELQLPEQRHVFNGGWGEDLLILLPVRTLGIPTVREPVGSLTQGATERDKKDGRESSFHRNPPLETIQALW